MTGGRLDLGKYLVISLWFGCNNNCITCMLSEIRDTLSPIGFEKFKSILTEAGEAGRFEGLILSGAEVTIFNDLERYITFASSLGRFSRIQIQTNGRRLGDKEYLRRLIDLGVNEFFVSIYGTEAIHDSLTRVKGSYRETMEGVRNLESFNVRVVSNTVLSRINYHDMPLLMEALMEERISENHLWNFFPMEKNDTGDLLVGINDFLVLLRDLVQVVEPAERPFVLKGFPECIPVSPFIPDNFFPATALPRAFWEKFGECGFGTCVHRDKCASGSCWGLSSAYINKYGDERNLLSPLIK
jgi:MoaA/NifB/PqqE/SkfB family radical SAM enzyme